MRMMAQICPRFVLEAGARTNGFNLERGRFQLTDGKNCSAVEQFAFEGGRLSIAGGLSEETGLSSIKDVVVVGSQQWQELAMRTLQFFPIL